MYIFFLAPASKDQDTRLHTVLHSLACTLTLLPSPTPVFARHSPSLSYSASAPNSLRPPPILSPSRSLPPSSVVPQPPGAFVFYAPREFAGSSVPDYGADRPCKLQATSVVTLCCPMLASHRRCNLPDYLPRSDIASCFLPSVYPASKNHGRWGRGTHGDYAYVMGLWYPSLLCDWLLYLTRQISSVSSCIFGLPFTHYLDNLVLFGGQFTP